MAPLWILLVLGAVHCQSDCSDQEYMGEQQCCRKCQAGSYVDQDCTGTTETVCAPCGDGEYMDTSNGELQCLKCPNCAKEDGLTEIGPCSATTPRRCGCAKGFYCEQGSHTGGHCQSCKLNVICPSGEGGLNSDSDPQKIVCKPCADGFFSSLPSQRPCHPWTRCEALGMETFKGGSSVSDAECKDRSLSSLVIISLVLAAAVGCSLILLLTYIYKRKRKGSSILKDRKEELKPSPLTTNCREGEQQPLKPEGLKFMDV